MGRTRIHRLRKNADSRWLCAGKEFSLASLREGMKFELRMEAENALNHPVFGTPNTYVDDPNFGTTSYTFNNPRQDQLALKLTF